MGIGYLVFEWQVAQGTRWLTSGMWTSNIPRKKELNVQKIFELSWTGGWPWTKKPGTDATNAISKFRKTTSTFEETPSFLIPQQSFCLCRCASPKSNRPPPPNFNFGAMWVSQEVHGESGESGDFNSPTREAWRKEPPCDSESFRFDATRSSKMWLEKRDQEAWPWLLIDFARCWVINSGSVGKDWNLEIPLVGVFCYSCGWMVYLQSWGRSSMMFNKIFLWEWFLLFVVTSLLCWVRIDIDVINAHP